MRLKIKSQIVAEKNSVCCNKFLAKLAKPNYTTKWNNIFAPSWIIKYTVIALKCDFRKVILTNTLQLLISCILNTYQAKCIIKLTYSIIRWTLTIEIPAKMHWSFFFYLNIRKNFFSDMLCINFVQLLFRKVILTVNLTVVSYL